MIYVLIMFFFGLTFGFATGNNTLGVIGIIGIVVLTVFGLTANYVKYKKHIKAEQKNAFNVYYSLNNNKKNETTMPKACFNSEAETVERCKELFEKAEQLLNSEYNDYMFGIDLQGYKRPLASKNNAKVREILDDSIDMATAAYLSIDDVIISPWQTLKKSLQSEIVNKYKEVTPYTTFLFLNEYYKKYNLLLVVYKRQTTHFATQEHYKFNW